MLNHPTVDKLNHLRLFGMARALAEQGTQREVDRLAFEERLGLLVDREVTERESRQLTSRLRRAKLRETATPEDVDFRKTRGLDRALFARLLEGRWVAEHHNILITGPTGVGKTFLACALANQACRQGHRTLYFRVPRLLQELTLARSDGRYAKLLAQLARTAVLVLDDWGLAILSPESRRDLLELFDDRHGAASTIITSQFPVAHWHDAIGDPTLADAILDRVIHAAQQLQLSGESMRKQRKTLTTKSDSE